MPEKLTEAEMVLELALAEGASAFVRTGANSEATARDLIAARRRAVEACLQYHGFDLVDRQAGLRLLEKLHAEILELRAGGVESKNP